MSDVSLSVKTRGVFGRGETIQLEQACYELGGVPLPMKVRQFSLKELEHLKRETDFRNFLVSTVVRVDFASLEIVKVNC